jgi:hypothetical protein
VSELTPPGVFALLVELRDQNPVGTVTGKWLYDAAIEHDMIQPGEPGTSNLARLVGQLARDGAVELEEPIPLRQRLPTEFWFNDLLQCFDVRPTMQGHAVYSPGGSALTFTGPIAQLVVGGNITNMDLVAALDDWEQRIESAEAPAAEKAKAKSWVAAMRHTVSEAGSDVAAKLLVEVLTRHTGF